MRKSQPSVIFWSIGKSPNSTGEVTNTSAFSDQIYSWASLISLYSGLLHTTNGSSFFMQLLMRELQNSYYKIRNSLSGYRTPDVCLRLGCEIRCSYSGLSAINHHISCKMQHLGSFTAVLIGLPWQWCHAKWSSKGLISSLQSQQIQD